MASIQDKAKKLIGDAYYGEGAVIGDGSILKMLMELFAGLIGGCPLGAKRAHKMVNGGPVLQRIARNRILWAAYQLTGDDDEAERIADVGMSVGQQATAEEFVKFSAA